MKIEFDGGAFLVVHEVEGETPYHTYTVWVIDERCRRDSERVVLRTFEGNKEEILPELNAYLDRLGNFDVPIIRAEKRHKVKVYNLTNISEGY